MKRNPTLPFAALPFLLALACGLAKAARPTPPADTPAMAQSSTPDPAGWWQPAVGASWQWQLTGDIDSSFEVHMYDLDLFEAETATIAALKAEGRAVVCYISAGSREDWRPDADQFPTEIIGKNYQGWPGEKWLDIRRIDLLAPVMLARLDLCAEKGFDGVEPDNIDAYTNDTGFPLTYADQLAYNTWLAQEAHARGLSIGLKNDPEQVADLLPLYDWALTEECFVGGLCEDMLPFIEAGKPVFAAEYVETGARLDEICAEATRLGFSVVLKHLDLDAYRESCP